MRPAFPRASLPLVLPTSLVWKAASGTPLAMHWNHNHCLRAANTKIMRITPLFLIDQISSCYSQFRSPTELYTNKPWQHLPVIKRVTQVAIVKLWEPQRRDPSSQIFFLTLIKPTKRIQPTSSKNTALKIEEVQILGNIHIQSSQLDCKAVGYNFSTCYSHAHFQPFQSSALHDLEIKTILERCCDIFLLNYCKILVNNWFRHYPNCWATSGEGEGGNFRGRGLISFLINDSFLPNAAIRENAATLKQLKLERLNIPQRIATGIQSFSPPGHWLKSGFSGAMRLPGKLLSWGRRMLLNQPRTCC